MPKLDIVEVWALLLHGLFYQIIGVSSVNWCLIIEKEISKIVMVKQDPVELEAVMRYFELKGNTINLILKDKVK